MNKTRRELLINGCKLFDLGLMVAAFMLASLVRLHQSHTVTMAEFFSMRVKIQNFLIFALLMLVWHLIFRAFGLYASHRTSQRNRELGEVVAATFVGTLAILAGAIIFHIKLVTPVFLCVFWPVAMCALGASRLAIRAMLSFARKRGRNLRNIVIVGTNYRALEFARRLGTHPEFGYRIEGFVDQEWQGMETFRRAGYALASDIEHFPEYLRRSVVDEVVIAVPFRSMHEQASRIAASCNEQGITVRVFSNILDLKATHSSTDDEEEDPVITHASGLAGGWPVFAKRVLDLVISSISLVVLSPLMLVTAILIKLTSPGPILFRQERLGLNKRHLYVYKFRTMVADAEQRMCELEHLNEVSGPVFKIKNDPRITRLGKFLRKTSIDELPQLINVIKGDMSLVGPRPLPVRDYNGFNEDWQRRRFSVKPGITCLWQIRGRSSIPFDEWMELDLTYIEKWSLWLDLQILIKTIPAVLRGTGAA